MRQSALASALALVLAMPLSALAEDDGNEFLEYMRRTATREIAASHIDNVWKELNAALFCMPEGDRQTLAFDAVRDYLESNPDQLFRPRRYLIIQGLRGAFPCPGKQ